VGESGGGAGAETGSMPHMALRHALEEWIPMLVEECDFAAAFLLLYQPLEAADPPSAGGWHAPGLLLCAVTESALLRCWGCSSHPYKMDFVEKGKCLG
jgi:hypothetical protein